ncbi:type VII secretion integral membrane protein EccD [Rhodococcoides yunnanense]|uniref:type VII secretion integral membrane protein EccD n=1 Tax=Rhodococcoides yunnanense TaxID=278209 RepID=UPI0009345423|nr:type VII secretion integral membrane protein EccD [Rhodococcus yunnanensis]
MTGDLVRSADRVTRGFDDAPRRGSDPSPAAMDLCRITILAKSAQVDMALPTDVPLALLLPGIVDLLGPHAGHADEARQPFVLSRLGRSPLPGTRTLDESGIRDGELLVLGDAESPAPAPLFDDLMYAVASAGSSRNSPWTSRTARIAGFVVGSIAVALACAGVLSSALSSGADRDTTLALAVAAASAGVLLLIAGSVAGRIGSDTATALFMSACALPLAFTAGVLFVPLPVGAPHLMLGAAAVTAVAILAMRLGGLGSALFTGSAVTAFVTAVAAATATFAEIPVPTLGAAATTIALAGLAFAPRLAMMQARLPLPPVPTAGAPLDDRDEVQTHSYEDLDTAAAVARSYLTGLVSAGSAVAAIGATTAALATEDSGRAFWPGIALALLTALVLALRGRTFAELHHAIPMVSAGAIIALTLLGAAVLGSTTRPLTMFLAAISVTVVALVFGSIVPTRQYSPVLRRSAELVEYAAIAGIVPIACWVCGLYSAMRAL